MRPYRTKVMRDRAACDAKKYRHCNNAAVASLAITGKQRRNKCEERRDKTADQFIGIEWWIATACSSAVTQNGVKHHDARNRKPEKDGQPSKFEAWPHLTLPA